MATRDQIEELKRLTAGLELVAKAEDKAAAAKEAYQADKSDKNKAAHRKASQELAEARSNVRSNDSSRVLTPGEVSLTPATVGSAGDKNKE